MLNQVKLDFLNPQTKSQQDEHFDEFEFLSHFYPHIKFTKNELQAFLDASIGWNTLVYVNGIVIGYFLIEPSKKSAELHGVYRPDMAQIVPQHKRIKHTIHKVIFNIVFDHLQKDKIIIKVHPENMGAKGFAMMYGFVPINNKDKGRSVWKLTKEKYYSRQKSVNKNPQD